jgi:hypothetical protein
LLGIAFFKLILRRSILRNPGIIKKLSVFLTGVLLWRLSSQLYRILVIGDWSLLFMVLI